MHRLARPASRHRKARRSLLPELPTIIVVHRKENRRKCTVEPLRGHPGFDFHLYPATEPASLTSYIRLGLTGPVLDRTLHRHAGLLVLDATWRYASQMEAAFCHIPSVSLPPVQTAYPRISKQHADPPQGLATIEAIFAAYSILGRPTQGLLDQYRWARPFLSKNAWLT